MSLFLWQMKHAEFSLLGRGKSTAAPSVASSQCTYDCLVWSGKIRSHRSLFFEDEDGRAVAGTSVHYVEMLWNFLRPGLSHCGIELSVICPSKMVQLPMQQERSWRSFGKCFQSPLFYCAVSFCGLHVHLILCLWSFPLGVHQSETVHYWTTDHRWPQDCNSEANFSGTRKHS
jgi:hypothetical protein